LLAADLVAERSEHHAAERADEEGDGESEQGHEQTHLTVHAFGEDRGHGHGEVAVDTEIEPLHEVADGGSPDRGANRLGFDEDAVLLFEPLLHRLPRSARGPAALRGGFSMFSCHEWVLISTDSWPPRLARRRGVRLRTARNILAGSIGHVNKLRDRLHRNGYGRRAVLRRPVQRILGDRRSRWRQSGQRPG